MTVFPIFSVTAVSRHIYLKKTILKKWSYFQQNFKLYKLCLCKAANVCMLLLSHWSLADIRPAGTSIRPQKKTEQSLPQLCHSHETRGLLRLQWQHVVCRQHQHFKGLCCLQYHGRRIMSYSHSVYAQSLITVLSASVKMFFASI